MDRPSRQDPDLLDIKITKERAQDDARQTAALIVGEIEGGGSASTALKHLDENVQSSLERFAQETQSNPNRYDETGSLRTSEFREVYMKQLERELLRKGVLPELAVAHGLNLMDADGTGITADELSELQHQTGPWTGNYKENELNFMFVRTLGDLYHEIRFQHSDIVGKIPIIGGGHELDEITRADLETFLSRARVPSFDNAQPRTDAQEANVHIAAVLLTKANRSFVGSGKFDSLENYDGHYDGKMSRDDLKLYREYEGGESSGLALRFLYENWDSPQVKLMRDGDFITRESLVRGTGYANMTELRAEVWRRQSLSEQLEQEMFEHKRNGIPYGSDFRRR